METCCALYCICSDDTRILTTLNESHKPFKKLSVFILKMIVGLPFKSRQCELFKANTKQRIRPFTG